MRYVVARVINSPKGSVRTARLLITDVPAGTSIDDVLAALEAAGRSADFSEAGVPFGNHEVKADTRGWPHGISTSSIAEAPTMTWAELTKTPTRNDGRRATLRFTDAEFAAVSLAAQRAGQSLQAWSLDALLAAAAEGTAAPAPAARVSTRTRRASEPLPAAGTGAA